MSEMPYSMTQLSNLITKGLTKAVDPRQKVCPSYEVPDQDTRKLLAQLILEETKETINALGFYIDNNQSISPNYSPYSGNDRHLESIIDGCCDLIYVTVGALTACGVPDLPHLVAVCRANESKFPNGQVIVNENGKYQKPPGWKPPNHGEVRNLFESMINMVETQNKATKIFLSISKLVEDLSVNSPTKPE